MLLLIYVPCNCTSKMQIADVVLNRPLNANYTSEHMPFLCEEFCNRRCQGNAPNEIVFSEAVQHCAGESMLWLESAYASLNRVDMKSALNTVAYRKCWKDSAFCLRAVKRFEPEAVFVPEQHEQEASVKYKFDQQDQDIVPLQNQEFDAHIQKQFYETQ